MTKTAKKNKRGARGSTEEESSVAKKPNMAELVDESGVDNEEESTVPSEESEETEASLLEIKHLLLGVQKTLHTMQSENRKMSEELKELRASFALRCGIAEKRLTLICISLDNKRITKPHICYMPRSLKL